MQKEIPLQNASISRDFWWFKWPSFSDSAIPPRHETNHNPWVLTAKVSFLAGQFLSIPDAASKSFKACWEGSCATASFGWIKREGIPNKQKAWISFWKKKFLWNFFGKVVPGKKPTSKLPYISPTTSANRIIRLLMADIAITSSTFSHGPVPLVLCPSLLGQHHVLQDLPCVVDIAPRQRHTCQSCSKKKIIRNDFLFVVTAWKINGWEPKNGGLDGRWFSFSTGWFFSFHVNFPGCSTQHPTHLFCWVVYHHRKPTAFHLKNDAYSLVRLISSSNRVVDPWLAI